MLISVVSNICRSLSRSNLQIVKCSDISKAFYCKSYGKFCVGDKASSTKSFTEDDVQTFARISGDTNPIHVDKEYAKTTRFGQPVVHGILTCG